MSAGSRSTGACAGRGPTRRRRRHGVTVSTRSTTRAASPTRAALAAGDTSDDALYRFRLALYHEEMHGEALVQVCHALHYARPACLPRGRP